MTDKLRRGDSIPGPKVEKTCRGCGRKFTYDPSSSYYHNCCSSECVWTWINGLEGGD